jgi:hypothetical protein
MNSVPSAERQVEFLRMIQSMFEDSFFQATYKYALLITLTDLSIELGNNDGKTLFLDKKLIAKRFAELYWPQIQPFPSGIAGCRSGILFHSDKDEHIKVIKDLVALSSDAKTSDFLKAQKNSLWDKTLSELASTVWKYPVLHLQEDSNQFLYKFPTARNGLELKPGVAYCLRKFSEFIIQYARNGWMDHIKRRKRNQSILGVDNDLESFLFGSTRKQLTSAKDLLLDFQSGKCFYCEKLSISDADIDHFIPWKKYPRNIAQNLVLSCPSCNRSKSDMLASFSHLDKWLTNSLFNKVMSDEISGLGFVSDQDCAYKVGIWAYKNGLDSKSLAWERPNSKLTIDSSYIALLEKYDQAIN